MTDSTMTAIPLVERLERPLVIEHAVPTPVHEVLQRAADERGEAAAMLKAAVEALELGKRLAAQVRNDLASAHAEICKLEGLDPAMHTWPDWSPQANTLRWLTNEIEPTFDNTLATLKQPSHG